MYIYTYIHILYYVLYILHTTHCYNFNYITYYYILYTLYCIGLPIYYILYSIYPFKLCKYKPYPSCTWANYDFSKGKKLSNTRLSQNLNHHDIRGLINPWPRFKSYHTRLFPPRNNRPTSPSHFWHGSVSLKMFCYGFYPCLNRSLCALIKHFWGLCLSWNAYNGAGTQTVKA